MMRRLSIIAVVVAALGLQGCYTLNRVVSPTDVEIEITNTDNASAAKHFTKSKKVHHFAFGWVSPEDVGIDQMVSDVAKLNKSTKVVNLKTKYQLTFVDGLIGILTGGIYTPFTLTVEGDVVQ